MKIKVLSPELLKSAQKPPWHKNAKRLEYSSKMLKLRQGAMEKAAPNITNAQHSASYVNAKSNVSTAPASRK